MPTWPDTVGLLYARQTGKTFRQAHSGVVNGLAGGLYAIGVAQVALIDCAAPHRADDLMSKVRQVERRLPGRPSLSTKGAAQFAGWRSRKLAPTTPIITLTSRAGAFGSRPLVSFEDMTAAQARRFPGMLDQSDAELARVQARQTEMYRSAVACCVGSDWAAASVAADYGVPDAKVHVVGRGHSFTPRPVERTWDAPRFLFMGRDWERKNGARVLAAFRKVRAMRPDAELRLVGDHPKVDEAGVISEGYLDLTSDAERRRLSEIFLSTTCLVMPSLLEPFGLSYLEAGSFAIPSIGTTVGGAAEAIGAGGLVVDPYALGDLQDAMLRLCEPDTARQLGEQALTNAHGFTWPRIAERILDAHDSARS